MPEFQRFSYDVLVIGAGGAGLRAAIEAGAAGAKVGVVCKSLLGKAHTVMAEGGIAAAMANVDDRDNWRVHFADTMRGGQYLNNWRMAELHAREAPDCVRELEAWGALFDRTKDGRILQRNFGGHQYPRLAHVGDRTGLALAYNVGAELQEMEFVQFHPTGMVWPISVRGILVTEGVRGEGGVLRNSEGRRFMFDDIPDLYKEQTADSEEEGWRYTQGDKNARRPPELLSRDHVARCINREVKAGRGSPHGGVFLDISWIKERMPKAAEHIKRKLPSMYHQFKQLADLDITKEPMEVGPTTHYMMGGIRVDGDSQMSTVAGLFAAGEAAAGLHGANRLGGNSLSDLVVFGKRAGRFAAEFASANGPVTIDESELQVTATAALAPFDRGPSGENPYQIQYDLQETMQDLVGIVRVESEMQQALEAIGQLRARSERAGVTGNREYNNGWHTAIDIGNMMVVSEAITRAALLRKESRGAQFREDFPGKDAEWGKYNIIVRQGADVEMQVEKRAITPIPDELKAVIEEMK